MTDNAFDHLIPEQQTGNGAAAEDQNAFSHLIPSEPVSNWDTSMGGRFMTGVKEPLYGAAQLAAHLTGYGAETMDKKVADLEKHYQAQRTGAGIKPEDWDYSAGLGNIVSPINYLPGAAVGRVVGTAGRAASLATRLGEGAMAGAAQGAFTPVQDTSDFAEKKAWQAGTGAAAGAAGAPIGSALARSMAPEVTPAARTLISEGVELTGPQARGGFAKKVEDILANSPVGGPIQAARQRGNDDFVRAAGQRALGHIGETIDPAANTGHAVVADVADKLGARYRNIHANTSLTMDPQLQSDLMAVGQQHRTLGPARLQQLQAYIDQNIEEPLVNHGGTMPGAAVHGGASNLQREAANLATDQDAFNRNLGTAIGDVHDAMNAALERQNPGFRDQLQAANRGYTDFVRIRQAASSTAAQPYEGTFLPSQLSTATRSLDRSAGKGASARGTAPMQDLAEAARSVMPNKIPDSGTAQRMAGLAMLGGHIAISPQTAALHAILPLLYSPTGVRLTRNLMTAQMPMAQGMGSMVPRGVANGVLSSTNPDVVSKQGDPDVRRVQALHRGTKEILSRYVPAIENGMM